MIGFAIAHFLHQILKFLGRLRQRLGSAVLFAFLHLSRSRF